MVRLINDVHIHLGEVPDINRRINEGYLSSYKDRYNIDKALGFDMANGYLLKLCLEVDWLYGLYYMTKETDPEDIIFNDKIIGLKYHGVFMEKPVTSLSDTILENLRTKILLVHCGRYLEGDIKSNTSYLHAINIARNYPDIKVILAHMGGTDTTVCKKAIKHGSFLWNVYFDTSGITTPYIIEYACNRLPVTRILFGSDVPWCSFYSMYFNVDDAIISDLKKQDIFHDNFELLLK